MLPIKVAVRVRSLIEREQEHNSKVIVEISDNSRVLTLYNPKLNSAQSVFDHRDRVKKFQFDYCFSSIDSNSSNYAAQQTIYDNLGTDSLKSFIEGFNTCVFCYGQTGSGKSYTMYGDGNDCGLIPRICEDLFKKIKIIENPMRRYKFIISFIEIYNEKIYDLLSDTKTVSSSSGGLQQATTLRIREHPTKGVYIQNLTEILVNDLNTTLKYLSVGNLNRVTSATHIHDRSSRSHAIFTVQLVQARIENDLPIEISSKLSLVDLAGSERASLNYNKKQLKEGANINKSLVSLGNLISNLADSFQRYMSKSENNIILQCQKAFIPYRDSVLTYLLKDNLGGNSKTIMIANISPASICYHETLNTLLYAQRAKKVVNKPRINEDPKTMLIKELKAEICRLKSIINTNTFNQIIDESTEEMDVCMHDQMTETDTQLEYILKENECMAEQLSQTWIDEWNIVQKQKKAAAEAAAQAATVASNKRHRANLFQNDDDNDEDVNNSTNNNEQHESNYYNSANNNNVNRKNRNFLKNKINNNKFTDTTALSLYSEINTISTSCFFSGFFDKNSRVNNPNRNKRLSLIELKPNSKNHKYPFLTSQSSTDLNSYIERHVPHKYRAMSINHSSNFSESLQTILSSSELSSSNEDAVFISNKKQKGIKLKKLKDLRKRMKLFLKRKQNELNEVKRRYRIKLELKEKSLKKFDYDLDEMNKMLYTQIKNAQDTLKYDKIQYKEIYKNEIENFKLCLQKAMLYPSINEPLCTYDSNETITKHIIDNLIYTNKISQYKQLMHIELKFILNLKLMQMTYESYVFNTQKCLKEQKKIQHVQKQNYEKLAHKYQMDTLRRIDRLNHASKYIKILNKKLKKLKASSKPYATRVSHRVGLKSRYDERVLISKSTSTSSCDDESSSSGSTSTTRSLTNITRNKQRNDASTTTFEEYFTHSSSYYGCFNMSSVFNFEFLSKSRASHYLKTDKNDRDRLMVKKNSSFKNTRCKNHRQHVKKSSKWKAVVLNLHPSFKRYKRTFQSSEHISSITTFNSQSNVFVDTSSCSIVIMDQSSRATASSVSSSVIGGDATVMATVDNQRLFDSINNNHNSIAYLNYVHVDHAPALLVRDATTTSSTNSLYDNVAETTETSYTIEQQQQQEQQTPTQATMNSFKIDNKYRAKYYYYATDSKNTNNKNKMQKSHRLMDNDASFEDKQLFDYKKLSQNTNTVDKLNYSDGLLSGFEQQPVGTTTQQRKIKILKRERKSGSAANRENKHSNNDNETDLNANQNINMLNFNFESSVYSQNVNDGGDDDDYDEAMEREIVSKSAPEFHVKENFCVESGIETPRQKSDDESGEFEVEFTDLNKLILAEMTKQNSVELNEIDTTKDLDVDVFEGPEITATVEHDQPWSLIQERTYDSESTGKCYSDDFISTENDDDDDCNEEPTNRRVSLVLKLVNDDDLSVATDSTPATEDDLTLITNSLTDDTASDMGIGLTVSTNGFEGFCEEANVSVETDDTTLKKEEEDPSASTSVSIQNLTDHTLCAENIDDDDEDNADAAHSDVIVEDSQDDEFFLAVSTRPHTCGSCPHLFCRSDSSSVASSLSKRKWKSVDDLFNVTSFRLPDSSLSRSGYIQMINSMIDEAMSDTADSELVDYLKRHVTGLFENYEPIIMKSKSNEELSVNAKDVDVHVRSKPKSMSFDQELLKQQQDCMNDNMNFEMFGFGVANEKTAPQDNDMTIFTFTPLKAETPIEIVITEHEGECVAGPPATVVESSEEEVLKEQYESDFEPASNSDHSPVDQLTSDEETQCDVEISQIAVIEPDDAIEPQPGKEFDDESFTNGIEMVAEENLKILNSTSNDQNESSTTETPTTVLENSISNSDDDKSSTRGRDAVQAVPTQEEATIEDYERMEKDESDEEDEDDLDMNDDNDEESEDDEEDSEKSKEHGADNKHSDHDVLSQAEFFNIIPPDSFANAIEFYVTDTGLGIEPTSQQQNQESSSFEQSSSSLDIEKVESLESKSFGEMFQFSDFDFGETNYIEDEIECGLINEEYAFDDPAVIASGSKQQQQHKAMPRFLHPIEEESLNYEESTLFESESSTDAFTQSSTNPCKLDDVTMAGELHVQIVYSSDYLSGSDVRSQIDEHVVNSGHFENPIHESSSGNMFSSFTDKSGSDTKNREDGDEEEDELEDEQAEELIKTVEKPETITVSEETEPITVMKQTEPVVTRETEQEDVQEDVEASDESQKVVIDENEVKKSEELDDDFQQESAVLDTDSYFVKTNRSRVQSNKSEDANAFDDVFIDSLKFDSASLTEKSSSLIKSDSLPSLDGHLTQSGGGFAVNDANSSAFKSQSLENLDEKSRKDRRHSTDSDTIDIANLKIKIKDDDGETSQLHKLLLDIEKEIKANPNATLTIPVDVHVKPKQETAEVNLPRDALEQTINSHIMYFTDGSTSFVEQRQLHACVIEGKVVKCLTKREPVECAVSDQISFETEGYVDFYDESEEPVSILVQGDAFKKIGKNLLRVRFRHTRSNSWPPFDTTLATTKYRKKITRCAETSTNVGGYSEDKSVQCVQQEPEPSRLVDSETQTTPPATPVGHRKPNVIDFMVIADTTGVSDEANTTKEFKDEVSQLSDVIESNDTQSVSNKFDLTQNTDAQTTTDLNDSFKSDYEIRTPSKSPAHTTTSAELPSSKPATHRYLNDKYLLSRNDNSSETAKSPQAEESKKWIELTEEKLNYLIGQTDAILRSLFLEDALCGEDVGLKTHLKRNSETDDYVNIYEKELERKKLEREKVKADRIKELKRRQLMLRKRTIIDAFNIERERELNIGLDTTTSVYNNSRVTPVDIYPQTHYFENLNNSGAGDASGGGDYGDMTTTTMTTRSRSNSNASQEYMPSHLRQKYAKLRRFLINQCNSPEDMDSAQSTVNTSTKSYNSGRSDTNDYIAFNMSPTRPTPRSYSTVSIHQSEYYHQKQQQPPPQMPVSRSYQSDLYNFNRKNLETSLHYPTYHIPPNISEYVNERSVPVPPTPPPPPTSSAFISQPIITRSYNTDVNYSSLKNKTATIRERITSTTTTTVNVNSQVNNCQYANGNPIIDESKKLLMEYQQLRYTSNNEIKKAHDSLHTSLMWLENSKLNRVVHAPSTPNIRTLVKLKDYRDL